MPIKKGYERVRTWYVKRQAPYTACPESRRPSDAKTRFSASFASHHPIA
jgi:hypothetical protein